MKINCARGTLISLCLLLILASAPEAARAVMCYGVGTRGSCGIYEVDFDTCSTSMLIDTEDIGWYGATDGDPEHPGTFYATPYGGSLYRVNVETHSVTPVGSNGYDGVPINGLAYDEKNGILYGTDYKNLYTIDITPGSPTEGMATLMFEFDACGKAWTFDYDASIDKLVIMTQAFWGTKTFQVDGQSGEVDYVGFTRVRRITDIWYDYDSGVMYGVSNNLCTGRGKLYQIDTETGQVTTIGCIQEDLLGLGKPTPVPEPVTVVLLCLGGLLLRKQGTSV
jgi:hypothetical protein